MASENETVAEIVSEMREQLKEWDDEGNPFPFTEKICDILISAHKREIAELRECMEQAYGDKIGTYTMKGIEVEKWRKALKGAKDGGK